MSKTFDPYSTPPSPEQLSPYSVRIGEPGYVLMPAMLGFDREFTIELWHRAERTGRAKPIIGVSGKPHGSPEVVGWNVTIGSSGSLAAGDESVRLAFRYSQQGKNPIRVQTDVPAELFQQWHHLAICRSAADFKIFVNGKPKITYKLEASPNSPQIPYRIGIGSDPRQRARAVDSGESPAGADALKKMLPAAKITLDGQSR